MTQSEIAETTKQVATEIGRLSKLRTAWEKAVVLTNKHLYDLLAGVAKLAISHYRNELETYARTLGLKPAKNTTEVLIAVKLVFGFKSEDERKKASAYSTAIQAGLDAGETPETLATWFAGIGGVEAARKKGSMPKKPSTLSPEPSTGTSAPGTRSPVPAPASSVAMTISSPVIEDVETTALERAQDFLANAYSKHELGADFFPEALPLVESGYCAVLMCPNGEGQYQQLFASSGKDVVNALLRALGRALDPEANPNEALTSLVIAEAKAKPDDAELDNLIDQATSA